MSRLGKTPISLPKGVEIKVSKNVIDVKGPKGSLQNEIPDGLLVRIEGDFVHVEVQDDTITSPFHGLYRNLLKNSIEGVSTGYQKTLTLIGVGFKAAVSGSSLDLQLGFSHPSKVNIPDGLSIKVEKSTSIIISGIDKQLVGQFAATVRSLRPPEPYKGKGVRYHDEFVRKKEGKAAKGK